MCSTCPETAPELGNDEHYNDGTRESREAGQRVHSCACGANFFKYEGPEGLLEHIKNATK